MRPGGRLKPHFGNAPRDWDEEREVRDVVMRLEVFWLLDLVGICCPMKLYCKYSILHYMIGYDSISMNSHHEV